MFNVVRNANYAAGKERRRDVNNTSSPGPLYNNNTIIRLRCACLVHQKAHESCASALPLMSDDLTLENGCHFLPQATEHEAQQEIPEHLQDL